MKKLNEETPEVNTSEIPTAETSSLENILAGYTEAATETPDPEANNAGHNLPPEVPEVNNVSTQWQGNPLYYQTGKKAGQLRPSVSKPKVEFHKDNTPTTISGEIISGALFMTMIDLLLPLFIVFLNNHFSKVKISPKDFELTEKQKKDLEPIAEKVAAQIRLTADPMLVMGFTLAGIYGINFMKARMMAEAKLNTKKDADK